MTTKKTLIPLAALPLVLMLPLAACAPVKMYPGPELPPGKTALITPMDAFHHFARRSGWGKLLGRAASLRVEEFDGKKPETDYINGIRAKPGRHNLKVNLHSCGSTPIFTSGGVIHVPSGCRGTPTKDLAFDAEAGRRYLVLGLSDSGGQAYWIEAQETGRVVAGRKPE